MVVLERKSKSDALYLLQQADVVGHATYVVVQIEMEPGGLLPVWAANYDGSRLVLRNDREPKERD